MYIFSLIPGENTVPAAFMTRHADGKPLTRLDLGRPTAVTDASRARTSPPHRVTDMSRAKTYPSRHVADASRARTYPSPRVTTIYTIIKERLS